VTSRFARRLALGAVIACTLSTAPPASADSGPVQLPVLPGVESDVNALLKTTGDLVGSVIRGPTPPRTTLPVPALPDLTPRPAPGAAPSSPPPQPPPQRQVAAETPVLREGANAGQTNRSASRSGGQTSRRVARPVTSPKPSRRAARPSQRGAGVARTEPERAPRVRADSGDALPRPVQAVANAIPDSMKAVLAGMSAVLLLLVTFVLYSRRKLAGALRRAHLDVLTGLPNRAAVDEALSRMMGHAAREKTSLAAVLFDIDHFKWINDRYGHTTGDEVLAAVGAVARAEVRAGDFVGRYGGEEFLLVLPDTGERGAARVCEKLQQALREIEVEGVETTTITASFGVAAGSTATGTLTDLVQRADRTMYRAKANGRDRIEVETAVEALPVVA